MLSVEIYFYENMMPAKITILIRLFPSVQGTMVVPWSRVLCIFLLLINIKQQEGNGPIDLRRQGQ